jgi:hypothetical protein
VYLDADEVLLGRRRRHLQQGLAHAETDFQSTRGTAAEYCIEIRGAGIQLQTKFGQALIEAALLAFGHAPSAHYETLDCAMLGGVFSRLGLLLQISHAVLVT